MSGPRAHLGTITRSHLHTTLVESVFRAQSEGCIAYWHIQQHGPYLANARNKVVRAYLKEPHSDVLLFVDSDMGFKPDDIQGILEDVSEQHPVVGGLYYNPVETEEGWANLPVAYTVDTDDDHHWINDPDDLEPQEKALKNVAAVGTGFMAIHKSLLDEMEFRYRDQRSIWFNEPVLGTGPGTLGEDLGFCYRVREMGYPVLLHTGVRLTHYKELPI